MDYKDSKTLQDAYQLIFEGKQPPCPCTVGKKCTKKDCPCPKCKKAKALKESHGGEASRGEPLSDPQMQEAMAILNQYAQGDITNLEAAKMIDDLYKKGAGHGPTQDDMYPTKI